MTSTEHQKRSGKAIDQGKVVSRIANVWREVVRLILVSDVISTRHCDVSFFRELPYLRQPTEC
jgi:DNA recombination-dependent growth factor C